ncbi:MAG TPA: glycosyltransferase family 87 protein [Candidatus Acidoferrum sp.]
MLRSKESDQLTPGKNFELRGWGGALGVVFVLFLCAHLQQESHVVKALHMANPSGASYSEYSFADFSVYYLAGKATYGHANPELYYPPDGSWRLNPQLRMVDPQTPWAEMGRAEGLTRVQYFLYPPLFSLLMEPFSRLSLASAYVVWRECNLLVFLLSIFVILRWLEPKPFWPILILSMIAAISFFPYTETAFLGQAGVILLLLWALGVCWAEEKPLWSALCFALGTMVKVTPVIVVPLFILRRQWRWLLGYVGWMTVLSSVSIWRFGWQSNEIYFTKVLPSMSCGIPLRTNTSLETLLHSIYFKHVFTGTQDAVAAGLATPSWICLTFKLMCLLIYAGSLFFFWKENKRGSVLSLELTILVLVSVLISPVVWRHSLVIVVLPLLFLWLATDNRTASLRRYVLLAFSTILIGTVLPFFALTLTNSTVLQIVLQLLVPGATVALLYLLFGHYRQTMVLLRSPPGRELNRVQCGLR